jgi:hypothetical protein
LEVECQACHGVPKDAPVYQCESGHLICKVSLENRSNKKSIPRRKFLSFKL